MFKPKDIAKLPDLAQFVDILIRLKIGDCWCEKGIDNPMLKDHTEVCQDAQTIIEQIESMQKSA